MTSLELSVTSLNTGGGWSASGGEESVGFSGIASVGSSPDQQNGKIVLFSNMSIMFIIIYVTGQHCLRMK